MWCPGPSPGVEIYTIQAERRGVRPYEGGRSYPFIAAMFLVASWLDAEGAEAACLASDHRERRALAPPRSAAMEMREEGVGHGLGQWRHGRERARWPHSVTGGRRITRSRLGCQLVEGGTTLAVDPHGRRDGPSDGPQRQRRRRCELGP